MFRLLRQGLRALGFVAAVERWRLVQLLELLVVNLLFFVACFGRVSGPLAYRLLLNVGVSSDFYGFLS